MTRIGPRMRDVAYLVGLAPGHYMRYYAVRVGPNGSQRYGYAIVNRAIEAGLVVARKGARRGTWCLYPRESNHHAN